ncbi:hypothetical protein DFJ74DRAFT_657462 [Hyaloraphidium curvatum]|nr:hypothetical protein DFJ74DRAFT_657462 [Hyaloraphidium curvatum]
MSKQETQKRKPKVEMLPAVMHEPTACGHIRSADGARGKTSTYGDDYHGNDVAQARYQPNPGHILQCGQPHGRCSGEPTPELDHQVNMPTVVSIRARSTPAGVQHGHQVRGDGPAEEPEGGRHGPRAPRVPGECIQWIKGDDVDYENEPGNGPRAAPDSAPQGHERRPERQQPGSKAAHHEAQRNNPRELPQNRMAEIGQAGRAGTLFVRVPVPQQNRARRAVLAHGSVGLNELAPADEAREGIRVIAPCHLCPRHFSEDCNVQGQK